MSKNLMVKHWTGEVTLFYFMTKHFYEEPHPFF